MYYYFTFGSGCIYADRFIKFNGTFSETRKKMFDLFGDKWAFQYSEDEWILEDGRTQEEKYRLIELSEEEIKNGKRNRI